MLPPLAATTKSTGSISHLPAFAKSLVSILASVRVLTCAVSEIFTTAAEVSINPPFSPFLPSATKLPETVVSPFTLSPKSTISPFAFVSRRLA